MKKITLLTFLILTLLLAACNSGTATPTAEPTVAVVTEELETVDVAEPAEPVTVGMDELTGTTWVWTAFTDPVQQIAVETPLNYTLTFQDDDSIALVADCNNAMGSYRVEGSSLTIEMGPTTMAACSPESRSDSFIQYLGYAANYFFEDGDLYIDLMADGGTLAFAPAKTVMADDGEGAVTGELWVNPWQWVSFTNPVEQFQVQDPENYVLTFNQDGTLAIQADCNNAMGSYTLDGSSISIEVGPMTRAACAPESRSDDFIKYLGFAAIYFFQEGDLYIDMLADGGTLQFSAQDGNAQSGRTTFSPDAEPLFGTLALGGGDTLWLDPTLVSVRSGTLEGPGVDATPLGQGCTGTIPARPDVVFNWEEHEGLDTLRVFTLSLGDPTLVLVTPGGEVLCSDDLNPLVLDPYIEIENPEVGRYAAFLGSFESDAVEPGFLVVTSHDLNPANMDLAQLFPREVDPRALTETLPIDVLEFDSAEAAQPAGGALTPADLEYRQELTGGGEIGAFNIEHENELCTGFISAAPTFRFDWSGDLEQLVLYFESNSDTTLQVLAPDGTYHCDDDYHGSENLNPWLSLEPVNGTYNVWVGSFAPDAQASGTFTISGAADATPVPLTSKDIEN